MQGYDRDRRVIYWNEASARLYGYGRDEAQDQLLEELIIPEPMREPVIQAHRAWVEQGIEIPADELELQHKSGEPVSVFSHHVMLNEHTDVVTGRSLVDDPYLLLVKENGDGVMDVA